MTIIEADAKGRLHVPVERGVWYRVRNEMPVQIRLIPMSGRKLFLHRLLWGFDGLVKA